MSIKHIFFTIIYIIIFISNATYAQTPVLNHLTTKEGLSQLSVNCLYVDESGILWIGTRVGLNTYDGKEIRTFKQEKNNPFGLQSNFIQKITGNKNGILYILTTDGICEYNMHNNKFTTLRKGDLGTLYYDSQLYVTEKNVIYTYDKTNKKFNLFYQLPSNISQINAIMSNKDKIWIGTSNNGIYEYNKNNKTICNIIQKGNITQIYKDTKGNIWAGSWDNGLYIITDNKIINYKKGDSPQAPLSSNFVRAICEDNMGNIWIGTVEGIDKYDTKNKMFHRYSAGHNANNLSHPSVWCIEKDRQGTLWIGTYFGGVNYFNPEYSIYKRYEYSEKKGYGLSNPVVGRMTEDDKGNLWIGTEGGGLNYLDREKGSFTWYMHNDEEPNRISHNNIKSLFYDKNKHIIWIGTHTGGLNKFNLKSKEITHFKANNNDILSLPSNIIRDILPYTNDSLIIATQNGLCIINKENGKCRQLLDKLPEKIGMVADIEFDNDSNLWIAATGKGVYVYNIKNGKTINYRHYNEEENSISNNNINNITTDREGNIWLSTSGSGLDVYLSKTGKFMNFDKRRNNLLNDCVYQTEESLITGNLLLITPDGFSILDKENKVFHNYNSQNGFPLDAINENAMYIAQDGEIFLGGIHNMVSFHEKDLIKDYKEYNIMPTHLFVNGEEIEPGDKTGILKSALKYTDSIVLSHDQNMISIIYSATNYIPENSEKIIYKLEGFSDKWNDTRNSNSITYTNLDPGEYKLLIKADRGTFSPAPETSLTIIIKAPFYKTPIAYIIYIISVCLLLWYLITVYKGRIRLTESLKLEQQHTKNIREVNQAQLRMFTNISHEFRTPLTLIISQIETLIQNNKFSPQIYSKLSSIYQSCSQLRELISELLDYRKHELGHLTLKVSYTNIVTFIRENYLLFVDYASKKNISIELITSSEEIKLWYDPQQMQKVLNNLLFNAIKHTQEGGNIVISIKGNAEDVNISISDNGEGIAEKDLHKIFDIFYQAESTINNHGEIYGTGTGIGLALVKSIVSLHHGKINVNSKPGKGSTFTITLPYGNNTFSENEKADNTETENIEIIQQAETSEAENDEKYNMLVVEDNQQIRQMLKEIFTPFYNVNTVPSADEALITLESNMPDIIITDVMMPGMNGKELCKKIKSTPETCHIPVVLLTAQTAVEQYIEGYQTGADDYITKPFNTQLLISRCNNLVNSRILMQEKFSHQPETTAQILATNKIDKDIIDKAISIIEANISNTDFNMNMFAKEMGMARTNLFTKIKAITGQTPNDFIVNIRLKKGANMLKNNPELNITEIAEKIGFNSSRYFSKCFKDLYHISPLSYRKGETEKDESENN